MIIVSGLHIVTKSLGNVVKLRFCEKDTLDLSYVVTVKSTVKISHNFVAFIGYMNFTIYVDKLMPHPSIGPTLFCCIQIGIKTTFQP